MKKLIVFVTFFICILLLPFDVSTRERDTEISFLGPNLFTQQLENLEELSLDEQLRWCRKEKFRTPYLQEFNQFQCLEKGKDMNRNLYSSLN